MKICFINMTMFDTDGISRVISSLASELAKTNDVTTVTFEDEKKVDRNIYGLSKKVNVVFLNLHHRKCTFRRLVHKINQKIGILPKLGIPSLYDWTYISSKDVDVWADFINKNNFDVVVAAQASNAFRLAKCLGKIHCKIYGWQHNSYEAYLENKGQYYYNQDYLFEKYLPKLNGYVVLNEHDEERFRETKRIETVTIYNPKSFVSTEKSSLSNKRFIACGGLRKAKGFDLLIESFSNFAKYDSEWIVDIFGAGDDKDMLEKLILQKNLQDRVFLKGETKEINKEMLTSSALLLSSRWEGMPMVVLEALECGLPVVAYDITAMIPLVTDGIEGRIIKKFDTIAFSAAMIEISRDHNLRIQYGRNAAQKAKLFDVEKIVQEWEYLFQK